MSAKKGIRKGDYEKVPSPKRLKPKSQKKFKKSGFCCDQAEKASISSVEDISEDYYEAKTIDELAERGKKIAIERKLTILNQNQYGKSVARLHLAL